MTSPVWTFQQLSDPKTTLTLPGWQAPFGRPRNGAIFNAGLKINKQRTNYPGVNVPPTIHKFGTELKPIEMHGRWMDRAMAQVWGAQKMVKDWKTFVSDQCVVRMTWGSIFSYQIFIDDMDFEIEGPGDVAWKLKAECLVDDQGEFTATPLPAQPPFDIASRMQFLMQMMQNKMSLFSSPSYASLLGMLNQISDQLDSIKAQINAPFARIYNTCSALTSFETAVSSDLTSMLAGISSMRTGVLALRDTTDFTFSSAAELNTPNALAVQGLNAGIFTGADMMQFATDKQDSDTAASAMLRELSLLQTQIEKARRGHPQKAHAAQDGDTWENIAERTMGSADGARKIRAMNGIQYGQRPVAGRQYIIPS